MRPIDALDKTVYDKQPTLLLDSCERQSRFAMDVIVHAVCYNEEKLLPFFLDYYSRFASKIVIWDNCSSDASVAIATDFRATNVVVKEFDTNNEFREDVNINIKNNCWKNDKADWVIVCDIDEFLFASDISEFFARGREFDVFKPVGFNMVSSSFPVHGPLLITDQIKTGAVAENYSKMVLFNPNVVKEIRYGAGAHTASPVGDGIIRILDTKYFNAELKLLHYKNISFEYRMCKNKEYAPRIGQASKRANINFHFSYDERTQREEFDRLMESAEQVLP